LIIFFYILSTTLLTVQENPYPKPNQMQAKTFKIMELVSEAYVLITIYIIETTYNKYDINLQYDFDNQTLSKSDKKFIMKNLELYDNTLDDFYSGEIIHKNPLTTHLIQYLLMDDIQLQTFYGNVTADTYRLSLLHAIKSLWD